MNNSPCPSTLIRAPSPTSLKISSFLLSRMNVKLFSVFTFCIPLISHFISHLLIKQVDFRIALQQREAQRWRPFRWNKIFFFNEIINDARNGSDSYKVIKRLMENLKRESRRQNIWHIILTRWIVRNKYKSDIIQPKKKKYIYIYIYI